MFFLSEEFFGDDEHLACMQFQSRLIVDVAQLQVCILIVDAQKGAEKRRARHIVAVLHIDAQRGSEKSKVHCWILMLKSKAKHIVAY